MLHSGPMDPPQKSPGKPPLITPSASPPPRRSLFSHAYNHRLPDAAPPLKRQRLASNPHRAPHDTSSSTSRPQSPADVQREREASKLRLLDVWSSLAERYTRRLDEDDIVDIRTGEITQDRGFIRNSRKVDFGAIAAPVTGDAMADEGTDEDEDDEYDTDELDAFADATSDSTEQSEMGLRVGPVPPVTAMDSADAEDLRAFLEAERRRKQLCGSEVEEDDYSPPNTKNQGSEVEDESAADSEDLDPFLPHVVADAFETYPGSQTALFVDSASEDELDNWDIDESSVVHPVLKHEDYDSDIEIVNGPTLSPLKSPQKLNLRLEKKSQTHQEQLHTPPLSHSSPVLPVTPPKDHFADVSSPPPAQTIPFSRTLAQEVRSLPLSPKHSNIKPALGNTPGPRLDLTQVLKAKKSASNYSTSHRPSNNRIPTNSVRTPSVRPYVLLTPRKSTGLAKSKTEKQNFNVDERQESDVFKEPNSESKDHSADPLAVVPSQVESPPRIDKRRSPSMSHPKPHSVNNRKDSQHVTLRGGSRSPSPSGSFSRHQSSTPQKRKRVSSDSETTFAVKTSVLQREEKPERRFTPRRASFSDDLPYHENQASTFYMISGELSSYFYDSYHQRRILMKIWIL